MADGKYTVFARKAGISTGTFQKYVEGRVPHPKHLVRIRETYGVDINWLLTGKKGEYSVDHRHDTTQEMERLRGEFEDLKKMVLELKDEMANHRKAANHAADHFEEPKKSEGM